VASDFNLLVRGSVILEWSPAGDLKRYVVQHANTQIHQRGHYVDHDVLELRNDDTLVVDGSYVREEDIERSEKLGYSYTYLLGAIFSLPD
jgi:hypothetical protein